MKLKMKIDFQSLKSDVSNVLKTIRFVYDSDKRLCFIRLILIIIQSILPLVSLFLFGQLMNKITNSGGQKLSFLTNVWEKVGGLFGNYIFDQGTILINTLVGYFSDVWFIIGLLCSVLFLIQIFTVINSVVGEILGQRIVDFINNLLHSKSLELDLTYYDNPEYHDTFHRAQQEASFRPIQILLSISDLITNIISFIGATVLLASVSGSVLLIMIIAGIPSLFIKLSRTKKYYNWRKSSTSLFRKVNYYSMMMTHRIFAKEMRIFKLGNHIRDRYNSNRGTIIEQTIKLLKMQARGNIVSSIFEVGALTVSIIILTRNFYLGGVTVGGFTIFLGAVQKASGSLNGIFSNLTGIYNNKLFLSNLFEFINLQPNIKQIQNAPKFPKLEKGIRVDNISFRYEGGLKNVLKNVSFSIKPGETVLITGKNGAGKTTLINLLCRMYECTSGTIMFDDLNIKDIDLNSLHKNIGIIYQDYSKYDLSVKDNIKFGDIGIENNIESNIESAAEMSGADLFIEDFPKQYDTVVGKYFQDGEELSTGQWQKIALARALYSDSQIIILDEPTSSIDLASENLFFEQLNNRIKDKIVIIIGHKITGKIKADSYYILQKGTLVKVNKELVNA